MSRDWHMYLDDVEASCAKIERFTTGMTQAAFQQDERTFDAVVRNLEIIGEASKHIPDEITRRMPGVEWRKVAGLRDVIAHAYFGIDENIIWDIVANKVCELRQAIERFREEGQG